MHNPRPRTKSGEDVFEKKQHENTLCRKKKKKKETRKPAITAVEISKKKSRLKYEAEAGKKAQNTWRVIGGKQRKSIRIHVEILISHPPP
jgi:hypothetical protein